MIVQEDKRVLKQINKTVQSIKKQFDKENKSQSKWTPAIARAYGLRIDQKIKTLGRNGISKASVEDKLNSIMKMLMGVSSGNLMNLAVSRKGGLLAKAALAKGLVTESQFPEFACIISQHLLTNDRPIMSFKQFHLLDNLHEKLFDGSFDKKTYQQEALEFLQIIGKMVDGRRVNTNEMSLRNDVFCLIQRPMTVSGAGYLIVKIVNDGFDKVKNNETEITINPTLEEFMMNSEVTSQVIKNYSAPKSIKEGDKIPINPHDVHAVSEDNKRYYLTFTPDSTQKMNKIVSDKAKGKDPDSIEDVIDDVEDEVVDVKKSLKKLEKSIKKESYLFEKSLSNSEIQDLIDSIKTKLRNRKDKDARGMLKLAKDIEATFKERKSLHPNSVVTIMRMASSLSGKWGVNSKDWDGSPPSGKLNKYPPSPTQYAS